MKLVKMIAHLGILWLYWHYDMPYPTYITRWSYAGSTLADVAYGDPALNQHSLVLCFLREALKHRVWGQLHSCVAPMSAIVQQELISQKTEDIQMFCVYWDSSTYVWRWWLMLIAISASVAQLYCLKEIVINHDNYIKEPFYLNVLRPL